MAKKIQRVKALTEASLPESEQWKMLRERISRIPPNAVYLLIASTAFVFTMQGYHPLIQLETWLAIGILVLLYRLVIWWLFRLQEAPSDFALWDKLSFLGSFFTVLVWAAVVPLFCVAHEPATVYITGLFLTAIASGGVLTIRTDKRVVLAYPLLLLGGYALWLTLQLTVSYVALASMVSIYLSFLCVTALKLYREHLQIIRQTDQLQHLLQEHARNEQYLSTLIDQVPVGIMQFGRDFRISACNPAYLELFQTSREQLIGLDVLNLKDQRPVRLFKQAIAGKSGVYEGEYRPTASPIERMFVRASVVPLVNDQGEVEEVLCTVEDLTDTWEKEQKIRHMAFYDPLTGIPNRKLLSERLAQLLSLYRRRRQPGALFYLDLDNFKDINDQYGHPMGDKLLVEAVRRIRKVLREEDTLARMGGDEFVILLPGVGESEHDMILQVEKISSRIHQQLRQPMEVDGVRLHTDASIGVVSLDPEANEEELLRRADLAMYRAKENGRGRTQFYDEQLDHQARERHSLQQAFREALEQGGLELYFQPILDMKGQVVAAEGLLRWMDPERGMVSPEVFIPMAEDMGMIAEVGNQVLEMGCAQLSQWLSDPSMSLLYLSLNASPTELAMEGYVEHLAHLLAQYRIPPHRLKLEITESVLLKPDSDEVRRLEQIQAMGVDLLIDDFGTGYASLEYMARYPFSGLKVDRGFISQLLNDRKTYKLVAAMLAIAEQFGYHVVLEGVENQDILYILRKLVPHAHFQGYVYSPPLPLETFEARLQEGGLPLVELEEES